MEYRRVERWMLAVLALLAPGCGEPTAPGPEAVFEVRVVGETFRAGVNDPEQIEALAALLASGEPANISGELVRGSGGVNAPWSWHLDPETVHVADVTIEVCDGLPSFVEDDLDYWLGTVKQYCPWGAKIVRRVR